MKIFTLDIPDVKILVPQYFEDHRGYFSEVYSEKSCISVGINTNFIQDNHSYSKFKGTIRGFHFQNNPKSQTKLVRCVRGEILDVVVDMRKDSPTYGHYVSVKLTAENRKQIFIPKGFLHAFMTLTDDCEVIYKVDEFYDSDLDRSIAWNDPSINFSWGIKEPILSDKDRLAPLLKDSDINF